MAFVDNLPVSESLGVFVGIAGYDWLAEGQAEPLKAAIAAVRSTETQMPRSPLDVLREKKTSKLPEPKQAPQKPPAQSAQAHPPQQPRPSTPPPSNPHEREAASVRTGISRDNAAHDISEDMLRRLLRDDR